MQILHFSYVCVCVCDNLNSKKIIFDYLKHALATSRAAMNKYRKLHNLKLLSFHTRTYF